MIPGPRHHTTLRAYLTCQDCGTRASSLPGTTLALPQHLLEQSTNLSGLVPVAQFFVGGAAPGLI